MQDHLVHFYLVKVITAQRRSHGPWTMKDPVNRNRDERLVIITSPKRAIAVCRSGSGSPRVANATRLPFLRWARVRQNVSPVRKTSIA